MWSHIKPGVGGFRMRGSKLGLVVVLALALVAFGAVNAGSAQAGADRSAVSDPNSLTVSARRIPDQTVQGRFVDVASLPVESTRAPSSTPSRPMPLLPIGRPLWSASAQGFLSNNPAAPVASPSEVLPDTAIAAPRTIKASWKGLADSASVCPFFGGCAPPDGAIAAGGGFVLEGVNTSFVVYDTSGTVKHGPFTASAFFGIPTPPAGCGSGLPFTSDPRAAYDQNDNVFWVEILEVENADGVNTSCNFASKYWVASYNPLTNSSCVYSFNMSPNASSWADYSQFGFNKNVIALSGNIFNNAGTSYEEAKVFFADKAPMESCSSVTAVGFDSFTSGGVLLDTLQPVETITTASKDPGVEYLINSHNMNGDPYGHDCFISACQGYEVWAYDPATKSIGGVSIKPSVKYIFPPKADEPGCTACVDTSDTRISATPVYASVGGKGQITFALESGIKNSTRTVPGVEWGQIHPTLSGGKITGLSFGQHGKILFSGDRAASYGGPGTDYSGNLAIVFYSMSKTINPGAYYRDRKVSDSANTLRAPVTLIAGAAATTDKRWGDYSATSFDGTHLWLYGQYAPSGDDWGTKVAEISIP